MLDKCCIVFDLDDTLYNEVEFIKSGYRYINKLVKKQFGIQIKYTPNKKQLIQSKTHIQFYIKKGFISHIAKNSRYVSLIYYFLYKFFYDVFSIYVIIVDFLYRHYLARSLPLLSLSILLPFQS